MTEKRPAHKPGLALLRLATIMIAGACTPDMRSEDALSASDFKSVTLQELAARLNDCSRDNERQSGRVYEPSCYHLAYLWSPSMPLSETGIDEIWLAAQALSTPLSVIPSIAPSIPKLAGCPGLNLSTPILSRNGREVAARDEATGTTKVFRLGDGGRCQEVLDIGRQTSKVGFSHDGRMIAYSSIDSSTTGSVARSKTHVYYRDYRHTRTVPHTESTGLVIPVVGTDILLVAVKPTAWSASTEFRLLCCVQ